MIASKLLCTLTLVAFGCHAEKQPADGDVTSKPASASTLASVPVPPPSSANIAAISGTVPPVAPPPPCGPYVDRGDVFAKPSCPSVSSDADAIRLTSTGSHIEAVEAHRGGAIAAVQREAGHATVVWLVHRDGRPARKLLDLNVVPIFAPPDLPSGSRVTDIYFPALSFDGRWFYFLADAYGTSRMLYAVNARDGALRPFGPANNYTLLSKCTDPALVDHLTLYQHRYAPKHGGGAWDWNVLFSPDGREVGPIGPTEENLHRFFARRCGGELDGPTPPPPAIPPGLEKGPLLLCGERGEHRIRVERRRISFLDGTELDVYPVSDPATPGRFVNWFTAEEVVARMSLPCPRR